MAHPASAQEQIKEFKIYLKNQGRFPATIEAYGTDVKNFLEFCIGYKLSLKQVDPEIIFSYQKSLEEKTIKPNSIRRAVIAIRQYFRFIYGLEKKEIDHFSPLDLAVIPVRIEKMPKHLSDQQIQSLLSFCSQIESPLKGARDHCLIQLLSHEGVKVSEIIHLKWIDHLDHKGLGTLRICGTKARLIQIEEETRRSLSAYKKQLKIAGFDTDNKKNFMFVSFQGKDLATIVPKITRHGVKFLIYELGTKIKIKKLSSEILRHYAIDHMLKAGRSKEDIMQHLGLKRAGNIIKHMG